MENVIVLLKAVGITIPIVVITLWVAYIIPTSKGYVKLYNEAVDEIITEIKKHIKNKWKQA